MTCLEEVSVIVAANLPVCLGRDDRGLAGGGQWGEDTFISIEGLVGDDGIGLHGWQEVIGAEQIVRLTSGQKEADRIAKGIDQGVDLGAQSAARTADRLVLADFMGWPAPHHRRRFCVRIRGEDQ